VGVRVRVVYSRNKRALRAGVKVGVTNVFMGQSMGSFSLASKPFWAIYGR